MNRRNNGIRADKDNYLLFIFLCFFIFYAYCYLLIRTKKFDDNQSMIDGLFTVEEYKELSKLLHDMKKNKKA